MKIIPKICPRDNGDCFLDEDVHGKFWTCLQCGNEISPEEMERLMVAKVKIQDLDKKTIASLPIPPRPDVSQMGVRERNLAIHDYLEAHKEQILAEVEKCGQTATRKRWGIASPTWTNLRQRWDLPPLKRGGDNRRRKPRLPKPPAPKSKDKDNGAKPLPLPAFPPWDEGWNDRVKIAWLTAYAEMGRR